MVSSILCLILAATVPCSKPSLDRASAAEWIRNTVTVQSTKGTGYGFVVGWLRDRAWIAVPAHVVFGQDAVQDTAPYRAGLSVKLFGETSPSPLCPTAPDDVNPRPKQGTADLAFVCVQWNNTSAFNTALAARLLSASDAIELAGPGIDASYTGTIAGLPAADAPMVNGGDLDAQGLVGVRGLSGAMTISAAGVVGMYLGQIGQGKVLTLQAIRANAEESRIPWELIDHEYYDCNRTRSVCLTVSGDVRPAKLSLRSVFTSGSVDLEPGVCADVPEGRYQISVPAGDPACEPQLLYVRTARSPLNQPLHCAPSLGVTWNTADGDSLVCIDTDVGAAHCSGLARLGWGFFVGTLLANGTNVTMIGSFGSGGGLNQPATGRLQWSRGRLSGSVQRKDDPPKTLLLTRGTN